MAGFGAGCADGLLRRLHRGVRGVAAARRGQSARNASGDGVEARHRRYG